VTASGKKPCIPHRAQPGVMRYKLENAYMSSESHPSRLRSGFDGILNHVVDLVAGTVGWCQDRWWDCLAAGPRMRLIVEAGRGVSGLLSDLVT
jgi:hypothetical protein